MRAGRHSRRRTHVAVATVATILLVGGLLLEHTLSRATIRARATLPQTVARASAGALTDKDTLLRQIDAGAHTNVAARLTARVETLPTAETRALAAHASTAAGQFDAAARHATFAWRLSPNDADLDASAQRAATLALWSRLRPPARVLTTAALLVLIVLILRARRRRRSLKRMERWVENLHVEASVGVDGRPSSVATPAVHSVVLDVFLRPRGTPRRPPRPGPTLAVVLSHATSGLTLRLRPRHDLRDDAIRIRLTDETLERVLRRTGSWRVAVLLAGHTACEGRLEVAPRAPLPRTRRMHLVGQA